jgi:hypothetical protein
VHVNANSFDGTNQAPWQASGGSNAREQSETRNLLKLAGLTIGSNHVF